MRSIRLTQIDGKLPNIALMKLSHFHKNNGDKVFFTRSIEKDFFEPNYDVIYGSAIFSYSEKRIEQLKKNFLNVIVGGTGSNNNFTVEDWLGIKEYENYDYSIYPNFTGSIGFTQRGCRLKCSFCVVPKKEGKNISINSISNLYRGEGYPKELHLLDNDFFGQKNWKEIANEIIKGNFKVCFNQGINVRLINEESANVLSLMKYYDDQFKSRRIYTAWDNRKDENIFKQGIKYLTDAGIKPNHIMVYMLCGYWPNETFEDIYYRFKTMVDMGLMPFPMAYNNNPLYKKFQRWVVRRYYQFITWEKFSTTREKDYYINASSQMELFK
jgi:hypothetical protein